MGMQLYPTTWAKYQQGDLSLLDTHGVIFLTADYIFDSAHESITDIPEDAIVATGNLSQITYDAPTNKFLVSDISVNNTEEDNITGLMLYRQNDLQAESFLVWYSDDIAGLPLVSTGGDLTISFPDGLLQITESGYTNSGIVITEVLGTSFEQQISLDIDNNLMHPGEFPRQVIYKYVNNPDPVVLMALITAIPKDTEIEGITATTGTIKLKVNNNSITGTIREGDLVTVDGITHTVVTWNREVYTSDIYAAPTIEDIP